MDLLTAVLIGVIQGIVEFFPVSSSGHLVLVEKLIGFRIPACTFHAFLHAGTSLAVVYALRRDVFRLVIECGRMLKDLAGNLRLFLRGIRRGEDVAFMKIVRTNYRKLAVLLLAATFATGLTALPLKSFYAGAASSVMYAGAGFLLTGVMLLVSSMIRPGDELPKDVPYWKMFLAGGLQGLAVLPGISRFGVTICACILIGMSRQSAVRISLLLLIPASAGALIAELILPGGGIADSGTLLLCIAGAVSAFLTGLVLVRRVLRFVRVRNLRGFSYYCFTIGILSVLLQFI